MLGGEGLLAVQRLPEADPALLDATAEAELARAIDAIRALRAWRDSVGVKAGAVLAGRLEAGGYESTAPLVAALARFDLQGANGADPVAAVPVPGGTVAVAPSEELDLGAAERKLEARRSELESEIRRAEGKLANEKFVAKAPEAVVGAERDKLEALKAELAESLRDSDGGSLREPPVS